VVGLTATATAQTLFAYFTVGALANLLVGFILARSHATMPVLLRLQFLGSLGTAASLIAQFAQTGAEGVIVSGLVFRVMYAIQDVPQNALASLLPADDVDTQRYSRLRVVLSGSARMAITLGNALVVGGLTGGSSTTTMSALGLTGSALVASGYWLTSATPSAYCARSKGPTDAAGPPAGLGQLLAAFAVAAIFLPLISRLIVFWPTSAGHAPLGAWLLAWYCIGSVAGPSLQLRLDRKFGDSTVDVATVALICTSSLSLAVFPSTAIPATFVHGVAVSALSVRLWTAASRVAQADAAEHGARRDSLVFGAVIFCMQLSGGLGALLLGPLLEGYKTASWPHVAAATAITSASAPVIAWLVKRGRVPAAA
jgi:Na+/melibiose symporter-like transporter